VTYIEPTTKVAGAAILAADYNQDVRANLKTLADPWTSYTPTLTNWAKGNGSISGAYMKFGRLVFFRLRFDAGSTSTFSGNPIFGLPTTAVTSLSLPVGSALLADDSGTGASFRATRTAVTVSSSTFILRTEAGAVLSSTVPWTWATNDSIEIGIGMYQAAS
jgi:hypothetical protein